MRGIDCGGRIGTLNERDQWGLLMFDKDTEALRLAETHYEIESGITEIYRLKTEVEAEQANEEPIKLLEVNQNTIPSGIMPLCFGAIPAHNIHFSTVVVEVTPEEFQLIRSHQLRLPHGWELAEFLPRPAQMIAP